MAGLCWGEREDAILVWRGRKKWAVPGLGEGNHKVDYLCGG